MSSQRDANQAMDDTDGWNEGLKEGIKYKKNHQHQFHKHQQLYKSFAPRTDLWILACYRILRVTLVSELVTEGRVIFRDASHVKNTDVAETTAGMVQPWLQTNRQTSASHSKRPKSMQNKIKTYSRGWCLMNRKFYLTYL